MVNEWYMLMELALEANSNGSPNRPQAPYRGHVESLLLASGANSINIRYTIRLPFVGTRSTEITTWLSRVYLPAAACAPREWARAVQPRRQPRAGACASRSSPLVTSETCAAATPRSSHSRAWCNGVGLSQRCAISFCIRGTPCRPGRRHGIRGGPTR